MRFIADAMLGRLARWLRFLGYDTLYDPSWDDAHLMRLARAEDRVLLTRDYELAERFGANIILVANERLDEQLKHLQHELSINRGNEPRCPICNSPLRPISKEEAWGEVPLYAYIDNVTFNQCLNCGRYYWPGSQWKRIRDSLSTTLS
ncbi:MAG: Mut7-C RNAse domain-containing protein [Anaerolineae bacterium]